MATTTFYGIAEYRMTEKNVSHIAYSAFRLHVGFSSHGDAEVLHEWFRCARERTRFTSGITTLFDVTEHAKPSVIYERELHIAIGRHGDLGLEFHLREGPRFMLVLPSDNFLHALSRFLMAGIPELCTDAGKS